MHDAIMIDSTTKLCCIIGNPVRHSLSPKMHNAAFKATKLNYVYLAFEPVNLKVALGGLLTIGIKGVSVTVPFKEEVLKHINQKDGPVNNIGAANTLVNKNGAWHAYNTDWTGAVNALKEAKKLKGASIVILGSGGAARAVAYGLKREDCKVYIIARNRSNGIKLVNELSLNGYFYQNEDLLKSCDILVNATPLGMHPHESDSPVSNTVFNRNQTVLDCVYTPKNTKYLNDAYKSGATVVYGYKMLLYQGIEQFKLFTGQEAPVKVMEEILVDNLK